MSNTGQIVYQAEKQACRAFPDPKGDGTQARVPRKFQILPPLDFLAEFTLIRTSMDDPADVLGKIVRKVSKSTAELAHCDNIRSVAPITRYTVKDMADVQNGEREVLLFKKGLGLNLSGQVGGYFVKSKAELWKECWREWFA